MSLSAILQLDGIYRQFPRSPQPAVQGVSLSLQQGDLLGLLGPSGCGKTTLLRLIAGFEQPQSGAIALGGRTVAGDGVWVPPEQRDVGMVFQDYALFPHLTVAENIAFGLQQRGATAKELVKERVKEAIALIGLSGTEQRYPHELSGGQQQRIALARALAPRPKIILLDEPLSNLDVQVRWRLRQEVRDILKATNTSGVFVTHDQEEALSIADQVAVMRQGQLEQIGTPEEIYRHPTSRFVAEFVTQANFIPAQRSERGWETEIGMFPASADDVSLSAGDLMLCQEDLQLELDATGEVVVRDRQFLGREYCYWLQTRSGKVLYARTPATFVLAVGTAVRISATRLKVFPADR
ncbi:ABC transporter ATP-binding protein [Oscillatoria sp. FACHB-1407]|uniref:ABC transporter ATP-binding protein n=1 Tax=Oscillatoria sp. FACHB-1407 TaxID=2692847 RepID=UPI0016849659|nr:ABC transporter ATP-binding protein [Oscillatoria sp. FACHB-1407]MBD2462345.1 ABC transporter ATP-binding protein [Oscillatoria sp. FACHB-1407]